MSSDEQVRAGEEGATEIIKELREVLTAWRSLVVEHDDGVHRYTVVPGAGLNALVGWTDATLTRAGAKQ